MSGPPGGRARDGLPGSRGLFYPAGAAGRDRLVDRADEAVEDVLVLRGVLLRHEVRRDRVVRRGRLERVRDLVRALRLALAHERLDDERGVDAAGVERAVGVGEWDLDVLDLLVVRAGLLHRVVDREGADVVEVFARDGLALERLEVLDRAALLREDRVPGAAVVLRTVHA